MVATTLPADELSGHEGAFARVAATQAVLQSRPAAVRASSRAASTASSPRCPTTCSTSPASTPSPTRRTSRAPTPSSCRAMRPTRPILVVADYYLATFLKQPTWVEDIRPFRAVMMPLDLPPTRGDIDRFIPQRRRRRSPGWSARARSYAFDMGSALRGALARPEARPRPRRLRRHGRGLPAGRGGHAGRRRLRPADVRARGEDAIPSCACSSARRGSTRRPSAAPWHPGRRAPPGATSTTPTPAR